MLKNEFWFPIKIGHCFNTDHSKIKDNLILYCKDLKNSVSKGGENWLSKETYNTSDGKHNIINDKNFLELNNWILSCIKQYAEKPIKFLEGWFNIYENNNFQEYHYHPKSFISAIYVLDCCENSSNIYFQQPYKDEFLGSSRVCYKSQPGKLIIFRSFLEHAVEKNPSTYERITLAYNFIEG